MIFAGIPWDAVEAAISEHNHEQQQDGRGSRGRGGEYDGECLFEDDRDEDKYNNNNDKHDNAEDGKVLCRGANNGENPTTTVAMLSAGHPLGSWGGGC